MAAGSTIARGSLTCGTGSGAATGALVTVTFSATLPATPVVVISAGTAGSGALYPWVSAVSATAFTISVTSPSSSQANTVYGISWYLSL